VCSLATSDDDPVYGLRFKKVFTTDLAKWKESTNLPWLKITTALSPRFKDLKCLPKHKKNEVWNSISNLVKEERATICRNNSKTANKEEQDVSYLAWFI